MAFFVRKNQKQIENNQIIIVSGLPRSGTSMLMRMLEAGGLEILTDEIRKADVENPKGYYEFERVKKLETDKTWLPQAKGKAVKIISMLLRHLPPGYDYKIIFTSRNIQEVLASQKKMLIQREEPTDKISDEELAGIYKTHLNQLAKWLNSRSGFKVLNVNYNNILIDPDTYSKRINRFIGGHANVNNMADVVDKALYRQRK
jgi:hypothetical protein